MKFTNEQSKHIESLKAIGIKKEHAYQDAAIALEKAKGIEKCVQQYVIENNEYFVDIDGDPENGERITSGSCDYMMNDEIFKGDYLPKCQKAFKDLYGIDHNAEKVYSWPAQQAYWSAEKEYYMVGVEFLRIGGQQDYADTLEEFIKGYIPSHEKAKLNMITNGFIHCTPAAKAI